MVLWYWINIILYSLQYKRSTDESEQKELLKKIKEIRTHREHLDSSVDMIQGHLLGNAKGSVRDEGSVLVDDWECLKSMVTKELYMFLIHFSMFLLSYFSILTFSTSD